MSGTDRPLSPELNAALCLHINERLFAQGLIPRTMYEGAKEEILRRNKPT